MNTVSLADFKFKKRLSITENINEVGNEIKRNRTISWEGTKKEKNRKAQ